MSDLICRACGQHHETGAEALACDHRLGRHLRLTTGCPECVDRFGTWVRGCEQVLRVWSLFEVWAYRELDAWMAEVHR